MAKYDFFIAGRWRNKDAIKPVLDLVRANGKSAYCFLENDYKGEIVELKMDGEPEVFMAQLEDLPQNHPFIQKIFAIDMAAERDADTLLLVFPAGIAAHIEAGVAYGLGKRCIAIGTLEKTETLYNIFEHIFPTFAAFQAWLKSDNKTP
jgi:hypothetical protein